MNLESKCRNLIVELMALEAEYYKLRTFAQEIKTREYSALLKSTEFSGRALDLRDRTVRLFSHVAQVLTCVDEARDIRLRLLQCTAPGSLDNGLRYATRLKVCSSHAARASSGLRWPFFSISHSAL